MNQQQIAEMMRAKELERRKARSAALIKNELALGQEKLNAEDQAVHDRVVHNLRRLQLQREKETTPGYFQRLWNALLNR